MENNRFVLKCKDGTFLNNPEINGLKVNFLGSNNYLEVEEGAVFHNCHFKLNDSCIIIIEKTQPRGLKNTVVDMSGSIDGFLHINKGCSIESCRFAMTNERNPDIYIGKDSLLSSNIVFRATDGHTIFDINTNKIINKPRPIYRKSCLDRCKCYYYERK